MTTYGDYDVSDDPARIDFGTVWDFMSTQAYWGRWRSADMVRAQVEGSWRVVGAYVPDGTLVGFARAVSDGLALAYLADVFVLRDHRGHGLGKALVAEMVDAGPGRDFRWMLHTKDAHGLYAGFGFAPPTSSYLERPARGPLAMPT